MKPKPHRPRPPHTPPARAKRRDSTGRQDRPRRADRGKSPGSPGAPAASVPPTDWADVADWYDQLVGESGSEYHRKVVLPGVLRLLALRRGEAAVDVACGQGVLCRLLHERGVEATGVDAAEPLVRVALERGPAAIRYQVGDARDLSFLPPGRFAAAACVLAIQNIHPIAPVFASVARLLRAGGRFVLVMTHPCFRGPKETSWGWDAQRNVQYRRIDRYLIPRKTPIVTHPGSAPGGYTWTFHKPLEAYSRAFRGAGLLIDTIEEWPSHKTSEPGPRAAAENTARKEIPLFLALRALKVDLAACGSGTDLDQADQADDEAGEADDGAADARAAGVG